MKLKKTVALCAITVISVFASQGSVSKEGMYTPDQLPEISENLTNAGLKIKSDTLTDLTDFPMGAIVSLGGCSASFVSAKGLVATNHHCARGSVQFNSTEQNNYLEHGFLAAGLKDELPAAPGSRIYVTKEVTDVTQRVLAGVSAELSGQQRFNVIDANKKTLLAECEKDAGHRCQVSSFFGGAQYKLNKRLEIKDVRIAYAPADAIGKYGGDIDNWLWPRHTGDFAFYRGYVSPEGESTEFSESNVPYQPQHYLKVSAAGVNESDFVMVAGYPGRTSRYARSTRVQSVFEWQYPALITMLGNWIDTIEQAAVEGSDARIKYEARLAGLNNAMKNLGGQLRGAKRVGLLDRRIKREAALDQWIAKNKGEQGFAKAISALDELSQESAQAARQEFWYTNATRAQLLGVAKRLYRLAQEKKKPDAEREAGYQERDMAFFKQGLQAIDRRYDASVDKAEWLAFLDEYRQQTIEYRVSALDSALGLQGVNGEAFDMLKLSNKLATYYQDTKLGLVDTRIKLMDASVAELEASKDPFIQLAIALYEHDINMEKADKDRDGRNALLQPSYMEAIIAWQKSQGLTAYPDANSNLRITYGNVMGGAPKDGLRYTPFTTLEGIIEKDTGEAPFNSPKAQLDLIKAGNYGEYELKSLSSVPVNFMSDLDITGGNSGSATLNSKAEFVGMVFDGTIEGVNSDWDFNERVNRAIHVDSRYMLWVMEKLDGAKHLIEEMDVVR